VIIKAKQADTIVEKFTCTNHAVAHVPHYALPLKRYSNTYLSNCACTGFI